jgi:hypothetical protein
MKRTRLARIVLMTIAPLAALAVGPAASAAASHSGQRPAAPMPVKSALASRAAPAASGPALAADALIDGTSVLDTYSEVHQSITVTSLGTGEYDIVLAGLGGIGEGNVQATAVGADASCEPSGWGPEQGDAANFVVLVNCFSGANLAAAEFFLTVTRPRSAPGGVFDYAFSYRFTGSGKLTGDTQYNSERGANSMKTLGTGRYQILFGGKPTKGATGVVKVTGVGTAAGYCNPVSFSGTKKGEVVDVDCFGPTGAPQEQVFEVVYATGANVLGATGLSTANAYVSSQSPAYQPADQYVSRRGGRVTVVHYGLGEYQVVLSGLPIGATNIGNMQVSAVGKSAQCEVPEVFSGGSARYASLGFVFCYNRSGGAVDSPFTVSYAVP